MYHDLNAWPLIWDAWKLALHFMSTEHVTLEQ